MDRKKTNALAMGGICLALTVIFLFGASFVPGVEMTLFAVSSLFVAVMVLEHGPRSGMILYVAAVILGLLLVPNKVGLLPFICFFGYYGVLKFYIEKIRKPAGQIAVKVVFFAALLVLAFWGTKGLLFGNINLPDYPAAVLLIGGILFMLLYDLIYTLLIKMYRQRVKREKQPEFKLAKDDENE